MRTQTADQPTNQTFSLQEEAAPAPRLPRAVGGRYRLMPLLGRGGMASVYRAHDTATGHAVAIKLLRPEHATPRQIARLAVEAVTMQFLAHPNVPEVLDMGCDDETGQHYVVLELASRGSTADAVRARGPIPVDIAARWLIEVLCALGAAHERGIVHRDVKPANILVGGDGRALLTDFGIVRTPDGDVEATGAVGTPSYMAPEQWDHADDVRPESDLYAAGATLYALLTATSPAGLAEAGADDPRWDALPEALRPIVFRATRKPDQRYPDARAMARALAPFVRPGLWASAPHLDGWLQVSGAA